MKKVNAIYTTLITGISDICDNVERMEFYWNQLEEDRQVQVDALSEALLVEKRKLIKCKRDSCIYSDYSILKQLLNDFNESFYDYPDFSHSKFNYIIFLSEKIFQNSSVIPDNNVVFEFKSVDVDLGFDELAYITNLSNLDKTIAWFSPTSKDSLDKLTQFNADIDCWYALLSEADNIDFQNDSEFLFYCKIHFDAGVSTENIIALLKLHMTSSGLKTIPSLVYSRAPSNSSIESYCPSQSYIQFMDVIGILGEYNNRNDVLSKYISIFHVIENFMFKGPIVKLERSSSRSMFSIRDFKRLYKSVDMDEPKAIKTLFKGAFSIDFYGAEFKDFAYQEWLDFLNRNAAKENEIYDFLGMLSINDVSTINMGNFFDFIARVVYLIRCSIVHNKETEFHISSENYPEGCKLILEDFLLKFLEELIFLLISKDNHLVWYTSRSIHLWHENA